MTLSTTITTICSKLKRSHIALFTAIISLGYASISQSQVITYENCNYTGKKADVPIGSFTWPNLLRDVPNLKDNDISSIKVSNGYKATLYADPNYKGKSITVTGDVDCLIAKQFNDTMSSIKVEGPTTQPTESQTRTQAPTKSNRRSNTLLMGESLPVGQSLRSLNGTFTATMGANCEFGVYAKMANPNLPLRALWTSESKNKGSGCYLELQKVNGHLVVFDENRSAKWASGLFSKLPGKRELTLKNDGDLVLTQNGNQIWSTKRLTEKNTKVVSPPVVVNSPRKIGNTLQEGSALKLGEKLTSSNGEYSLMLHQNCTLSVDKGAVNLWKTDKSNKIGTCRLYVSGGNLMLRTQGNSNSSILETIVWAPLGYDPFLRSKAPNQRARLVIQDDGYLDLFEAKSLAWTNRPLKGEYFRSSILKSGTGKCLHQMGSVSNITTNVKVNADAKCAGNAANRKGAFGWTVGGPKGTAIVANGQCLQAKRGINNPLYVSACKDPRETAFRITSKGEIKSYDGLCVSVMASSASAADVKLQKCNGSENQIWTFGDNAQTYHSFNDIPESKIFKLSTKVGNCGLQWSDVRGKPSTLYTTEHVAKFDCSAKWGDPLFKRGKTIATQIWGAQWCGLEWDADAGGVDAIQDHEYVAKFDCAARGADIIFENNRIYTMIKGKKCGLQWNNSKGGVAGVGNNERVAKFDCKGPGDELLFKDVGVHRKHIQTAADNRMEFTCKPDLYEIPMPWNRSSNRNIDGCSNPGQNVSGVSKGITEQFRTACIKHDVCYRAPWGQSKLFGIGRNICDKAFLADMNQACEKTTQGDPVFAEAACYSAAETFYQTVDGVNLPAGIYTNKKGLESYREAQKKNRGSDPLCVFENLK